MGIGRALVAHALRHEQGAVLSVSEANKPARALYKSLGFSQTARRIVLELRPGGGQR
jgi:ribosomal protein S18 acetylase RimI-like enzyme